ncbi:hypothetical protein VQ056_05805 [Paenibacillus sp. JTLBN-2024]|jgi:hypothetical protein|uniref:Aspartyl-phosphate phosphatase Spo0E family protein n=1 Tax=Paenibacillus cookii TaxID=157839 RepID=A0ABQ4LTN5_9BACL|nr:hypothetical protein [Paenibacillus cookii]KHF33153.1 hypothetical protein CM49_04598 [Paenibacillus sp. P1XP2]GIO66625.1 hypothetical protein J21TS3_14460 [Paenibacillus cookii]HWO53890.1 hypothetical protein [Paenibacillus cookii]
MSQAVLERRSEMLKKHIQQLLIRDNQHGISRQQSLFLQQMIKELHQTSHEMNGSK